MDDATTGAAVWLLDLLPLAEGLKRETRHSWLSDGRRESVAEHTWFVAPMALLAHGRLEQPVRLDRVLAMALVHDPAEAEAGDVPFFGTGERRAGKERANAPPWTGSRRCWEPGEHDLVYTKMDARGGHDAFLRALCAGIRASAEAKMRAGGVDVDAVRRRVAAPGPSA